MRFKGGGGGEGGDTFVNEYSFMLSGDPHL